MDEMPSSEFRRRYATLTEPTTVRALGRVIGRWIPADYVIAVEGDRVRLEPRGTEPISGYASVVPPYTRPPFTPVPKKGK